MLKILIVFLIGFATVNTIENEAANFEFIVEKARQKIKGLQTKLNKAQQQLKQCQLRCQNIGNKADIYCTQQRKQKQKLALKVQLLQDKNKLLEKHVSSKIDDEDTLLHRFKQKITQLQNKLKGQIGKVQTQVSEKLALQNKLNQYKLKGEFFINKINDLEDASSKQGRTHLDQINQLKRQYQTQIKNAINSKCQALSNQLSNKQQVCQSETKTFKDKIKSLQQAAIAKAKQFGENVLNTKRDITTRIKNYLTGKGPYNKQDEQQFAQFKQKVANLEQKIQQKLDERDRILRQKEEFDFQQKYCVAKLADYKDQINKLEKQAQKTGKQYYINQIKRIQRQSAIPSPSLSQDQIIAYKQKVSNLEQKLRLQLEQNDRLSKEKRIAEQKAKSTKQDQSLNQKLRDLQFENNKLKKDNQEYKKVIQQIYELKHQ